MIWHVIDARVEFGMEAKCGVCWSPQSVQGQRGRDNSEAHSVRLTMHGTAPRVHVRESDWAGVYTALPLDGLNVIESTDKADKSTLGGRLGALGAGRRGPMCPTGWEEICMRTAMRMRPDSFVPSSQNKSGT